MTKSTRLIILGISLLLIFLLILSSLYIKEKTIKINNSDTYNARKEDLFAKQQQLEEKIMELNKTLQSIKADELFLADQLSNITGNQVNLVNITKNTSTPLAASQATTPTPTTPTRPKVTRAS